MNVILYLWKNQKLVLLVSILLSTLAWNISMNKLTMFEAMIIHVSWFIIGYMGNIIRNKYMKLIEVKNETETIK